jgi:transcriptional regulator GlxA family with amidase domain
VHPARGFARDLDVLEVSLECGFTEGGSLSHFVRKELGMSPREVRQVARVGTR